VSIAAVKERPILMSAPMVLAILNGSKTQTRRVMKAKKRVHIRHGGFENVNMWCRCSADGTWIGWEGEPGKQENFDRFTDKAYPNGGGVPCPYGVVGDRLWVRETWGYAPGTLPAERTVCYFASPETLPEGWAWPERRGSILDFVVKRPSIFMPRWASRITLEITDVRLQRLQDISDADARAEGVRWASTATGTEFDYCRDAEQPRDTFSPVLAFRRVIDAIHDGGKHEEQTWRRNPFVWALSFRRVTS
jgi:hypothetical protein